MGRPTEQTSLASKINTLKKSESLIILITKGTLQSKLNEIQARRTQGYISKNITCKKASCIVNNKLIIGVMVTNE